MTRRSLELLTLQWTSKEMAIVLLRGYVTDYRLLRGVGEDGKPCWCLVLVRGEDTLALRSHRRRETLLRWLRGFITRLRVKASEEES